MGLVGSDIYLFYEILNLPKTRASDLQSYTIQADNQHLSVNITEIIQLMNEFNRCEKHWLQTLLFPEGGMTKSSRYIIHITVRVIP